MAFCPNCGTEANGKFCPNCGTTLGSPGAGTGSSYAPPGSYQSPQAPGLNQNLASALCYLCGLITGIIFLLLAPYNRDKTIRFHAFQSIFANIGVIVLQIICTILIGILAALFHGFTIFLFPLLGLFVFCLWLYMMYTAYNGQRVKLPVVGDLAEKQV